MLTIAWLGSRGASKNLLPQTKSHSALLPYSHSPKHAQWKGFLCVLQEIGGVCQFHFQGHPGPRMIFPCSCQAWKSRLG